MRKRPGRDLDSSRGLSHGVRRFVPLARFRREVVALLVARSQGSRRIDGDHAIRLVAKWDGVVRSRWAKGLPPCNVADHIAKYEAERVVCPCGSSRDPDHRCRRCGRRAGARVPTSARDPECVLLDENAYDYGTGSKSSLLGKGKRGQSVMCASKDPKDLVDVYPVRDPDTGRLTAKRRPPMAFKKARKTKAYGPYKRKGGGKTVIIVQRDPERELRKASTKTLLKLLDHCEKKGDHQLCRMVEKELDRRGRGF